MRKNYTLFPVIKVLDILLIYIVMMFPNILPKNYILNQNR